MVANNPQVTNSSANAEAEKEWDKQLERDGIDAKEVIDKAKSNVGSWYAYFGENLSTGKDDINFLYRDQWSLADRQSQKVMGKAVLSFDKLSATVRKIVGEQRKNKPALIVRSLTGKATQEEIDLREDMVRSIAYQSQCDLVYQSAFASALTRGFGAYQVNIEYENDFSFKQVVRYEMIRDVHQVAFDPAAIEPHKGDGAFCARMYQMSKKEFEAAYPHAKNGSSFIAENSQNDVTWASDEDVPIQICDYFEKSYEPFTLLQLSNGESMPDEDYKKLLKQYDEKLEIAGDSIARSVIEKDIPSIKSKRLSHRQTVIHYRLLNDAVIDYSIWPSQYLPIVFVDGDSHFMEGRQFTTSFVHNARDSQRFYNFLRSEIVSEVKNRRKEQWLISPNNIGSKDMQEMWKNPESQQGALVAIPDPKTGAMPQKLPAWELSQSLIALCQQSTQEMREIMGFAESEIDGSRDISGAAKMQRRLDSAQSTYVYHDNLNQAIAQGGRVVLDLLPVVYGQDERGFVLSKQDGSSRPIVLNKAVAEGRIVNALKRGDFDIEIDTGPSFAVQKEAALELFLGLVQSNPQIFPMVADLIAKNLDVQFRPQIEERFKNFVPAEILAKEAGEPPPEPQPDPQAQLVQQEMQLRSQELQEREQEMQLRAEKYQIDKEKHELEKAKLYLDMNKLKQDADDAGVKNLLHAKKLDLDYEKEMAKLLRG